MLKAAIVILNWNGKSFLQRFLPSVYEHSKIQGVKVFVADNGSDDDSVAFLEFRYPEIEIIRLDRNYGFAGGYNRALEMLNAEYFILLNSDVEVQGDWLKALLRTMDSNNLFAACMPKILSLERRELFEYAGAAGGYIDRFGYTFCRGRVFESIETDYGQYDDQVNIFWASGACLVVRAELFKLCGGFDTGFFAHMEEIDLCWRLKNRGYQVVYVPGSTVYHLGGGTLPQGNPRKTYLNFRNNLYLLYKNLPENKLWFLLILRLVLDGVSALRFLLKSSPRDCKEVVRAHISFWKNYRVYKKFRIKEKPFINRYSHKEIYPRSIAFRYFLGKKYTFRSLNWKP